MSILRRAADERRNAAILLVVVVAAIVLVVIFGGTLTRSTGLDAEAQQAQAEVDALLARVEAGVVELEFIETDEFVLQVARSFGWGQKDERPFRLRGDAPPPDPVPMLGSAPHDAVERAPIEEWMELLFGA